MRNLLQLSCACVLKEYFGWKYKKVLMLDFLFFPVTPCLDDLNTFIFNVTYLYILFHYQCIFKTVKLMHHIYFSIIYKFINKWYFCWKNSFSVMCTNCFNTYFKYCKVIIEMDIEQVIASFWKFLPKSIYKLASCYCYIVF